MSDKYEYVVYSTHEVESDPYGLTIQPDHGDIVGEPETGIGGSLLMRIQTQLGVMGDGEAIVVIAHELEDEDDE